LSIQPSSERLGRPKPSQQRLTQCGEGSEHAPATGPPLRNFAVAAIVPRRVAALSSEAMRRAAYGSALTCDSWSEMSGFTPMPDLTERRSPSSTSPARYSPLSAVQRREPCCEPASFDQRAPCASRIVGTVDAVDPLRLATSASASCRFCACDGMPPWPEHLTAPAVTACLITGGGCSGMPYVSLRWQAVTGTDCNGCHSQPGPGGQPTLSVATVSETGRTGARRAGPVYSRSTSAA
jgi:hypothetical protein